MGVHLNAIGNKDLKASQVKKKKRNGNSPNETLKLGPVNGNLVYQAQSHYLGQKLITQYFICYLAVIVDYSVSIPLTDHFNLFPSEHL